MRMYTIKKMVKRKLELYAGILPKINKKKNVIMNCFDLLETRKRC